MPVAQLDQSAGLRIRRSGVRASPGMVFVINNKTVMRIQRHPRLVETTVQLKDGSAYTKR